MAVPKNALKKWEKAREFTLGLPGAGEEFPWDESVAKVDKKVFVFLGVGDGSCPLGATVKLRDDAPTAELLCDRVEESYRVIGPKRLIAELDAH